MVSFLPGISLSVFKYICIYLTLSFIDSHVQAVTVSDLPPESVDVFVRLCYCGQGDAYHDNIVPLSNIYLY